jgi:hypothetical protein
MLEGVTDEGVAQQMVQRMAELAVWNKYGWGATKEVFGIAEAQDVGVEGPDMRERIEKAKKIKEKEEKEQEKEKEGKGDKGSSGRPGSWSEGGSRRPAFWGSCYNCRMYGHSARYCGLGQGQGVKGFQGS